MDNSYKIEMLEQFLNQSGLSENDLMSMLRNKNRTRADTKLREYVQRHKKYEGRCFVGTWDDQPMFPAMEKYYKVVSCRSENLFRVSCLTFCAKPTYWFDYQASKIGHAGDFYLGHFQFDSFEIEDVMVQEIEDNMLEISEEDFNKAAQAYLQLLLKLKWYPDHYRYGGVMPDEPKWRQ